MDNIKPKLEWDNKYSVGVEVIDQQHQKMFTTINELIDTVSNYPTKEKVMGVVASLVEYKKFHFATEEKYFKDFNFDGADDHIAKHQQFSDKLVEIQNESGDDYVLFAFKLVDFLEDWLIDHLMTTDQLYKDCFAAHGLK